MDADDLKDEDPNRFKHARDGDFLMCPFQCDKCHFCNLNGTLPDETNIQDQAQLMHIRRAILDSFWARERSTVENNRREGARYLVQTEAMNITRPYPPRGPFPIADVWGMGAAIVLLTRSLSPGKNADFVQFETIRKTRSHVSNFFHTIPGGMGDMFISNDSNVSGITNSPTNSFWFKRFIQGCHQRMGDVWSPDRPLTISEALACQDLLEEDWKTFGEDLDGRLKTSLTALLVTVGLGGGLRGEEINRLDIGIIRKHWADAVDHPDTSHIPLGMAGRFKRTVGEKIYVQPLAPKSNSGLNYRLWMFRALQEYASMNVFTGPVFRTAMKKGPIKIQKAKVGDMDQLFHSILARVQAKSPKVLSKDVNIEEEFSVSRSLKRGATAQARNMNVPADVIEANNRWRKKERSRGSTPHMSLLERYTDARASVPLLIKFSEAL